MPQVTISGWSVGGSWTNNANAWNGNTGDSAYTSVDLTQTYATTTTALDSLIPSSATITGFEVEVYCSGDGGDWIEIELYKGSTSSWISNSILITPSTTAGWRTAGSETNNWNTTWDVDDDLKTNFGVRLTYDSLSKANAIYVHAVMVTFYFTLPNEYRVAHDAVSNPIEGSGRRMVCISPDDLFFHFYRTTGGAIYYRAATILGSLYSAATTGLSWSYPCIYKDSTYANICGTSSTTLYYNRGTFATSTVSFGTTYTASTEASTINWPSVTKDTDGFPWIAYMVGNAIKCVKATATNGSAWGSATTIDSSGTFYWPIILPLSGGKMVCLYTSSTGYTINLKKFNGSTWDSSPTTVGTTDVYKNFSACVHTSDDTIYIVYYTSGVVYLKKWTYSGGLESAETIDDTITAEQVEVSTDSDKNVYVMYSDATKIYGRIKRPTITETRTTIQDFEYDLDMKNFQTPHDIKYDAGIHGCPVYYERDTEEISATTYLTRDRLAKAVTLIYDILGAGNPTAALIAIYNIRNLISTEFNLLYHLKNYVTESLPALWKIMEKAVTELDLTYKLRNFAESTQTALWKIRELVVDDISLIWDIITSVSVESPIIIQYKIRNFVSSTETKLWTIRNYVTSPESFLYKVRNFVTTDSSPIWNIRNFVESTKTFVWDIIGALVVSMTALWNIRNTVTSDRGLQWSIRNFVEETKEFIYRILNRVEITETLSYKIRNFITTANTLIWNIGGAITTALTQLWKIRNTVASDSDLKWSIRNFVTQAGGLIYKIRNIVEITNDLKWRIFNLVESARTLVWNLGGAVVAALVLIYNIGGRVISDRILQYNIRNLVSSDESFLYRIRNLVTQTETLVYKVRNLVVETGVFVYNLFGRIASSESLVWNIREAVSSGRVLKYRILESVSSAGEYVWKIREFVTSPRTVIYKIRNSVTGTITPVYDILGYITALKSIILRYRLLAISEDPYNVFRGELYDYLLSETSEGGELEGFKIYKTKPRITPLFFPCVVIDFDRTSETKDLFGEQYDEGILGNVELMFKKNFPPIIPESGDRIVWGRDQARYYREKLIRLIKNFPTIRPRTTIHDIGGHLILPQKPNHTLFGAKVSFRAEFVGGTNWESE